MKSTPTSITQQLKRCARSLTVAVGIALSLGPHIARAQTSASTTPSTYLLVGDLNHANNAQHHSILDNFDMLINRFHTDRIFLELTPSLQPTIDSLAAGKITKDEFKQQFAKIFILTFADEKMADEKRDLIAQIIQKAAQNNILVYGADVSAENMPLDIEKRVARESNNIQIANAFNKEFSATHQTQDPAEAQRFRAQSLVDFEEKYPGILDQIAEDDIIITTYRLDDHDLHTFITTHKGTGTSVVVMGNLHLDQTSPNGLRQLLAGQQIIRYDAAFDADATNDSINKICANPKADLPPEMYIQAPRPGAPPTFANIRCPFANE